MTVTQSDLFERFRQKVRDPNGSIWPDAQVLDLANDSIQQLESDGTFQWDDNVASDTTITLSQGVALYDLPEDFAQFDVITVGQQTIWPENTITFEEAKHLAINASYSTPVRYYFRGGQIGFYPIPDGQNNAILSYRKTLATITEGDSDIPLADDFVKALIALMAANAFTDLGPDKYERQIIKFTAQYEKYLSQLKRKYQIKSPSALNYKVQRRFVRNRQRVDKIL